MDDMITIAGARPVQNWYDTVPLNDIAKRSLRDIEDQLRQAAGDWALVSASRLDEAEALAGEHYGAWLLGTLGLTTRQATRIRAMAIQTVRDREALRLKMEGHTQAEIGVQLNMAQRTVSDAIGRSLPPLAASSANGGNPVPDSRVKLTVAQKDEILERYEAGETQQSLADEFNVSRQGIQKVVYGRRNIKHRREKKAIISTPLPTTPSAGNDVSSNGALVTPPVGLFSQEGHELQKQAAYYNKRFVEELKHCFAAIDNATRRLDKIHNAVLDDMQKNHRSMYLRWTVYEQIWSREMQLDLECACFTEIERRLESKAKLLAKKVKHAFSDLHYDRTKITIAK